MKLYQLDGEKIAVLLNYGGYYSVIVSNEDGFVCESYGHRDKASALRWIKAHQRKGRV